MKKKLVINFKTYQKATGKNVKQIAKAAEEINNNVKEIEIIICPQFTDIPELTKETNLKIYSQHIDPITPGSHTGHILPKAIKEKGVSGTLLNHSEKTMKLKDIEKANRLAQEKDLKTIICVNNTKNAEAISKLDPSYVAIEPPELIGGDTSVTTADPGIIKEAVKKSNKPVLCGAGVSDFRDFEKALELGARGVLVASAITKAENPKKAIKKLINK